MQLHQLLRLVANNVAITLFDINGMEIGTVLSKELINIDLYEYVVVEIATGFLPTITNNRRSCMYIIIQK